MSGPSVRTNKLSLINERTVEGTLLASVGEASVIILENAATFVYPFNDF